MATVEELLAEIDANMEPELSVPEQIMGYSRSYLSGPTFNFADNIEAGIASLFTPLTYDEELANIRTEQDRFKRKTDYLDNIVEIGSGAILNPLDKIRKVKDFGAGLSSLNKIGTSAPAQAALAGAGAADGEDVLEEAAISSLFGAGGSAIASVGGSALEKSARAADRFKLGAYDIGAADINRQLKKLGGSAAELGDAGNIPLVKTLQRAESKGWIDAGADLLTNAKNLNTPLDSLGNEINQVIIAADKVVPHKPFYNFSNTLKYIDGLSGTAKEQAEAAALKELGALEKQIGTGSLRALQKAKVGLNYKHDKNPYTEDIVKTLREDLKEEIESRVDNAFGKDKTGTIKALNAEWGSYKDLQDTFVRHGSSDLQGTPLDDLVRAGSTTGGVGSLNVMSATSGNPLYSLLGALTSAGRWPEAQSAIADVLRDPAINQPFKKLGKALPEVFTGRNVAQMRAGANEESSRNTDAKKIKSLIQQIDSALGSQAPRSNGQKESGRGQSQVEDLRKEISLLTGKTQQSDGEDNSSQKRSLPDKGKSESKGRSSKSGRLEIPSLFQPTSVSGASQSPSIFDVATEDQVLDALRKVESNDGKYQLSPAGARGHYQFMPKMAKAYGVNLDDNDPTDDREGARQYLKDEQEALFDMALSLAAYNAGRPAVLRAQKKAGAKDFASIAPYLPEETRNYVPAIERALAEILSRST